MLLQCQQQNKSVIHQSPQHVQFISGYFRSFAYIIFEKNLESFWRILDISKRTLKLLWRNSGNNFRIFFANYVAMPNETEFIDLANRWPYFFAIRQEFNFCRLIEDFLKWRLSSVKLLLNSMTGITHIFTLEDGRQFVQWFRSKLANLLNNQSEISSLETCSYPLEIRQRHFLFIPDKCDFSLLASLEFVLAS